MEKYGRASRQATDDSIILCMRFACWIPKATNAHSEYAILIAFPRQHWLRERSTLLRSPCLSLSQIHTKHIHAPRGQKVEFLDLKGLNRNVAKTF